MCVYHRQKKPNKPLYGWKSPGWANRFKNRQWKTGKEFVFRSGLKFCENVWSPLKLTVDFEPFDFYCRSKRESTIFVITNYLTIAFLVATLIFSCNHYTYVEIESYLEVRDELSSHMMLMRASMLASTNSLMNIITLIMYRWSSRQMATPWLLYEEKNVH